MKSVRPNFGNSKAKLAGVILLTGANVALDIWQMKVGRYSAYYSLVPIAAVFQLGYFYLIIRLFSWLLEKAEKLDNIFRLMISLTLGATLSFLLSLSSGVIRLPELQLPLGDGVVFRPGTLPDPFWPGLPICLIVGYLAFYLCARPVKNKSR
ncbi:MAG: hypothetical protein RLZ53_861 [Actinomycetota bacterium]|jgi:hypothetical protein